MEIAVQTIKKAVICLVFLKKKCNFAAETLEASRLMRMASPKHKRSMSTPLEPWKEQAESDILFSRVVKAGKRVYYIDVKSDRRGEYYLAMTESKRIKDGTETERPIFEKHKIFLYREDMLKFFEAFGDAVHFVGERTSLTRRHNDVAQTFAPSSETETDATSTLSTSFDIEF